MAPNSDVTYFFARTKMLSSIFAALFMGTFPRHFLLVPFFPDTSDKPPHAMRLSFLAFTFMIILFLSANMCY
jgi:hypothetical protein